VRVFVRLVGEIDSVAIRLLWDWDKKKLLAWGDDIPLPAIAKLWRESEMSFVAFDFNTSQAVHLTFSKSPDGTIVGLTVHSKDGGNEVTARKTQ
jgi:predicted ester cyclase